VGNPAKTWLANGRFQMVPTMRNDPGMVLHGLNHFETTVLRALSRERARRAGDQLPDGATPPTYAPLADAFSSAVVGSMDFPRLATLRRIHASGIGRNQK